MSGNDPALSEERRREAGRWLTIAVADMSVVRLLLEAREPMLGIAAYHCQQAAEKVVKGMLVIAGAFGAGPADGLGPRVSVSRPRRCPGAGAFAG
jgi:hypothetical protein